MPLGVEVDQIADLNDEVSALCVIGRRPHILTGIFVWLAISQFSDQRNIADDDLRGLQWRPENPEGGSVSPIKIATVTQFDPQQIQKRPAILVKRNATQPFRLGINDRWQNLGVTSPGIQANSFFGFDGGEKYEVLLVGSHTYFCIDETGLGAEKLGAEVFYRHLEFATKIRDDLGFHRLKPMEMGAAQKLEESKEHWVVPVVVSHVISHAWVLRMESPILKGVSIEALEKLGG